MKLRKLYIGLAAVGALAATTACSEDDTLSGAKEVYLTIEPASYNICVGDTIRIDRNVTVKNLSGNTINAEVTWTSDDPEKLSVVQYRDTFVSLGDTVFPNLPDSTLWYVPVVVDSIGDDLYTGITARAGSQGLTTKLRATLPNGKFAIAPVTVTNHKANGITPLTENFRTYRSGSYEEVDTLWFEVDPWAMVDDYTPTASLSKLDAGPSKLTLAENPIYIDRAAKRLGVLLVPDRSYGEFSVTLTVGDVNATTPVSVGPEVKVGMYDPDPLLGMTSPPAGNQSYGFFYEVRKTMDINSEVEIHACLMIPSGWQEDFNNARNSYRWEMGEGSGLRIIKSEERTYTISQKDDGKGNITINQVPYTYGYDCVLTLKSGTTTGENVINFCSADTAALTMTAYITVRDYDNDYPVNDIVVTPSDSTMTVDNIWVAAGKNLDLDVAVDPITSLGIWRPTVEVADPTVLEFVSYSGTLLQLKGLKPGTTDVKLSSHGVEKIITVTVFEDVAEFAWATGKERLKLAVGQSEPYTVKVATASGLESSLPVTWSTADKSILSVEANGTTATVKALAEGTTTLTATVTTEFGSSKSLELNITVSNSLDDIVVSDNTVDARKDDVAYYQERNAFLISLISLKNEYGDIWIYTKESLTNEQLVGTLTTADFTTADLGGTSATITDANLTIDSSLKANGSITLSIGGASRRIVFEDYVLRYQE